jgi:hypothetical protein
MTRRGSLIYYLSAWILGCFFMSLAIWIKDSIGPTQGLTSARSAFGLIFFYFYGLILGALATIVAAFLLRRLMLALKCKTPSHWAITGAVLTPAIAGVLGWLGRRADLAGHSGQLLTLLTTGPKVVLEAAWWLAIPAGAATAYLLCRIERAFATQPEPPKATA